MSNGGTIKKRSSPYFHFVAGLGSGLTSAVLLQPADLLKTRVQQAHNTSLVQTIKTIASGPNPIRQLWRGTLPSALRTGFGSALYFTSLNALRQKVAWYSLSRSTSQYGKLSSSEAAKKAATSSALPKLSNTANLLTGALARTFAGFIMMPVTVIKVRYESSLYSYSSLLSASRDIVGQHGLRGFFAGFGATAIRDAPYAGLYVLFYEQSKKRLSSLAATLGGSAATAELGTGGASSMGPMPPGVPLPASTSVTINFGSGLVSAVLSTALTNPFDAVKTRLQLMPDKYKHMGQAVKIMLKQEGVGSLMDGLGLRIARKGLSSALAWTLYEELIRRAEKRFG